MDKNGPILFPTAGSINEDGTVAMWARLDDGGSILLTGDGTTTTTLVDESGPFSFLDSFPSINDAGTVAFMAHLDDGTDGIFTGADPVLDKVITAGDLIDGFEILGFGGFSPAALNNAGQIAFSANVFNATTGVSGTAIFVATPITVAVPAPAGLLLIGLVGLAIRRGRPISS